jgi:hypothetical protein
MLPLSRLVQGKVELSSVLRVKGLFTVDHKVKVGFVEPDSLLPLTVHLVRSDSTSY